MPFLANAFVGVLYTVTAFEIWIYNTEDFSAFHCNYSQYMRITVGVKKGGFAVKVVGYRINFDSTRL